MTMIQAIEAMTIDRSKKYRKDTQIIYISSGGQLQSNEAIKYYLNESGWEEILTNHTQVSFADAYSSFQSGNTIQAKNSQGEIIRTYLVGENASFVQDEILSCNWFTIIEI